MVITMQRFLLPSFAFLRTNRCWGYGATVVQKHEQKTISSY